MADSRAAKEFRGEQVIEAKPVDEKVLDPADSELVPCGLVH
jgi:hypothetical protein